VKRTVAGVLFFAASVLAQYPACVFNAASMSAQVAPGSLAVVQLNPPPGGGLPVLDPGATRVELDGVPVRVMGRGPSPASVLVLIPRGIPPGTVVLKVTAGDVVSDLSQATIVDSSFGLFANTAQNISEVGARLNRLTLPARSGQYITLWGTGLGNAAVPEVLVGGIAAEVAYAGPAPGLAGVDQINARVPDAAELPQSCNVALQVRAGGRLSNLTTIAIENSGEVCRSPIPLSRNDLARLDAGGTVVVGRVDLSTAVMTAPPTSSGYSRDDSASAAFMSYDSDGLGLLTPPVFAESAIAGCTEAGPAGVRFLAVREWLSAGERVTLASGSRTIELTPDPAGSRYTADLAPSAPVSGPDDAPATVFEAGTWRMTAPGSNALQALDVTFTVPRAIRVTNLDALQRIDRAHDAVVKWDPESFTSHDVVTLTLNGTRRDGLTVSSYAISCRAPAPSGQVTIPAALLRNFLPYIGFGRAPSLAILADRRPGPGSLFFAPRTTGTPVPGVISFRSLEQVTVNFAE
jgi:uncharacterized protein (TIGR03437 family)